MATWYEDVAPGYPRPTLNVAEVVVKEGATWSVAPICPVGVMLIILTSQLPVAVPVPLIVNVLANDAYATEAKLMRTIAMGINLFFIPGVVGFLIYFPPGPFEVGHFPRKVSV